MNPTQLQKDINEMKLRLASMEAELNKPVAEPKVWRPGYGGTYYWVNTDGTVRESHWGGTEFGKSISELNNVYKTREQAEHVVAVAKAKARIVNKLRELEGDWVANWTKRDATKHFVVYDIETQAFITSANFTHMAHPPEMYSSKDACQWVAVNMTNDLKLVFGVD